MNPLVEWPFPLDRRLSRVTSFSSKLVIGSVGILGKILAESLNKFKVHNKETLYKAVEARPKHQPLLTFCNHYSCLDDPLLWGILRWRHLTADNARVMRWSLAAADVCFKKERHAVFCSLGRVVPVVRGGGVYQRGMDYMLDKLNSGAWVHTFPEGRVNLKQEHLRIKWGIGRLVAESKVLPIIIPIWHHGMDNVLPNRRPYYPRIGQPVTVIIGNPIDLNDDMKRLKGMKVTPVEMRKQITDILQREFWALKEKAEHLHMVEFGCL